MKAQTHLELNKYYFDLIQSIIAYLKANFTPIFHFKLQLHSLTK